VLCSEDGTGSDARLWEVAVADGVVGVIAGETAVIEIVAVAAVAGESRLRKENPGYAVGRSRLVRAGGLNFVSCGGSGGRVQDNLGQYFVEGGNMWDMDL
jgi:hypothetical protein